MLLEGRAFLAPRPTSPSIELHRIEPLPSQQEG
jgi:hypothetical protein